MMDGSSKLTCIGIIGDGCGGGREFIVENEVLTANNPQTNEKIVLLENIIDAQEIRKSGCILTLTCKNEVIKFDLSLLKRID